MKDAGKTKKQLLEDLTELRRRITAMEEYHSKWKQTEESLRESEVRYRSFVENFLGIAFRGGMDFRVIFFHGAVEEISGYTEEEFTSGTLKWDDIIHPGQSYKRTLRQQFGYRNEDSGNRENSRRR